jgi:hypothetical protein
MSEVTGEQLHRELSEAARAAGMSLQRFARPLFSEPNWKLEQLRIARKPKPSRIARVRALIAGEPLPEPSGNQYCRDARAYASSRRGDRDALGGLRDHSFEPRLTGDVIAARQALTRRARAERRPGETLQSAIQRLGGIA